MISLKEQIENLTESIIELESKIKAQKITKSYLDILQKKLDALDRRIDQQGTNITTDDYATMLELQALIHYAEGDIVKAKEFAEQAQSNKENGEKLHAELTDNLVGKDFKSQKRHTLEQVVPEYFTVSTQRLILLNLITASVYSIYWGYKNWIAIKKQLRSNGDKSAVLPIFSALFFPITAYNLFLKVKGSYKEVGLDPNEIHAGSYGWGVFLLNFVCLCFLPLIGFQKYMNEVKIRAFGQANVRSGTSPGEVIFILLGCVLVFLWIVGTFATYSDITTSDTGSAISQEAEALYAESVSLTSQYETCSNNLIERDKTLNKYSQADIDAYNADYDACDAVRIKQNQAAEEYNKAAGLE